MSTLLHQRLTVPIVKLGRVLDVDTKSYVLKVGTDRPNKVYPWVSFATPYQHMNNGEGIYFMPEVGSLCWICEPSTGDRAFVMAWAAAEDDQASHRAMKVSLNPGDIYLGTRDENHIILRRGGVVEVGATPLAQRLYIPIDNVIKDLCANYSMQTLGGTLEWSVGIDKESKDGNRPTKLVLNAREFANDQAPIATAQIGSHKPGDPTILSLVVREQATKSALAAIELTMAKTGDIKLTTKGNVTWDIKGNLTVGAQNITLTAKDTASLIGTKTAVVKGGVVDVTSTSGGVAIQSATGTSIKSDKGTALSVADASHPIMLASPALISWMKNHTHICSAPGSPSQIPAPALTDSDFVSQDAKSS